MEINLQNVEEQIFFDKKIQKSFPEFRQHFEQWKLSKTIPGMGSLGKQSLLEFLSALQPEHLTILEEYFGEKVQVNKIDHKLVRNINTSLEEFDLSQVSNYKDFCVYRNKNGLHFSFWR